MQVIDELDDIVNESFLKFEFVSVNNQADTLNFDLISEPEGT